MTNVSAPVSFTFNSVEPPYRAIGSTNQSLRATSSRVCLLTLAERFDLDP